MSIAARNALQLIASRSAVTIGNTVIGTSICNLGDLQCACAPCSPAVGIIVNIASKCDVSMHVWVSSRIRSLVAGAAMPFIRLIL